MQLLLECNGTSLWSEDRRLVLEGAVCRLEYDLDTGRFCLASRGLVFLRQAYGGARVEGDDSLLSTSDSRSSRRLASHEAVQDQAGQGIMIAIVIEDAGKAADEAIEMRQFFTIYGSQPYILTSLELAGRNGVSTNYLAPVVADNQGAGSVVDIGAGKDVRALYVPYDNDYWVRYVSCPIRDARPGYNYPDDRRPRKEEMYAEGIRQSYEVTAIFDNPTRKGFIAGSVWHQVWKTGIKITGTPEGGVAALEIYGGCADRFTRDYLRHGFVKGARVMSPTIMLGYYDDYRDGLEAFGSVCRALTPPLPWDGGPIFGWNAYAAYEDKMDYARFIHTSRFLKQNLQDKGYSYEGKLYVNFDYLWGNLSEQQLYKVVAIARANGQHAGIYFTPFSVFTDDLDAAVEGSGGRYTYRDIILRDYDGQPLPKVNSGSQGYAADPTHPGNIIRVESMLNRFIKWGFDFVKLDFIAHGAIEGSHYNDQIQTGKQAYDFGMKHLCSLVTPEKIGRPFFISLSIAPAFPYHGHARRISCDAFGQIADSEYMLNSLSYGWWMNGTIYCFNDPDHIVMNRRLNSPAATEQEARTRINSGIICGSMFLNSDAFMDKKASGRAIKFLTNRQITSIAKTGRSFRPAEGDSGNQAVDVFYRHDGDTIYLAVFNYDGKKAVVKAVDLPRVGLAADREYVFADIWNKKSLTAKGSLTIGLAPCESVILQAKTE